MGLLEASLLGIGPALALFYLTFQTYDPYINDRGLFIAMFTGMVMGWVFFLPEAWSVLILDPFVYGPTTNATILTGAVVSVFAIAFYQEGLRGLVLNLPAIRGRWQSPFWGMALGLGAGAVFALLLVAQRGAELEGAVALALNLPFVVALILAQGAFGGIVGLGVSENRAVRGFFVAAVGHMAFNGLVLAERLSAPLLGSPLLSQLAHWGLILTMLALGASLYRHMVRQLPRMLPKAKQTQRRAALREAGS